MLAWRYYKYSCSSCKQVYLRSLSPFQLGSGKRRCPKCAMIFNDGSIEWPVLRPIQKFEYIFPTSVLGALGGTAVTVVFAFFVAADMRELGLMVGVLLLFMVLPWAPYFLRRIDAVRNSKERFVRRQTFGQNEGMILPD